MVFSGEIAGIVNLLAMGCSLLDDPLSKYRDILALQTNHIISTPNHLSKYFSIPVAPILHYENSFSNVPNSRRFNIFSFHRNSILHFMCMAFASIF
jgi:hypothetical protein